jgi:type VI secretion system protein ImpE
VGVTGTAPRDADLAARLASARDAARREPGAARHRVALFQLLALAGEWDRAAQQLDVASGLDPELAIFAAGHKALVAGEKLRAAIFAGARTPVAMGEPPPWFGHLVQALALDAQGEHAAAKALRDEAFGLAAAVPGRIGGEPFAWLADADERLGPVLELHLDGRYLWLPLERVRRIETDPPEHLRDTVWLSARLTLVTDATITGFLPVRYPGSEAAGDDALRLGRRTEWRQLGEGSWVGLGQRVLATDAGEHALLDTRLVELGASP